MITQLIESTGYNKDIIRGIITLPQDYLKETVVIFIAGFERFGSEPKRRHLKQQLNNQGIASLRFDLTGLGDSDGKYDNPTIDHCVTDLTNMVNQVIDTYQFQKIVLVGHSVGSCIALAASHHPHLQSYVSKLVLLTPALNQAQLTRYWFTMGSNKDIEITFDNYKEYLNEEAYQASIQSPQTKKANLVQSEYSQQMAQANFESLIPQFDNNIIAVFGSNDTVVPRSSVSHHFINEYIVNKGDHDCEKPQSISQRVPHIINFITK